MRLLIASDLHGSLDSLRFLCDTAQHLSPDMLVLLGDLVYHGPRNPLPGGYDTRSVLEELDRLNHLPCPVTAVRGNCDAEVDQMVLDFPCMADYSTILDPEYIDEDAGYEMQTPRTLFLTHGHVFGPDRDGAIGNLPQMPVNTALLYGHTHVKANEPCSEDPTVWLFNPGSLSLPKDGSHSYGVYTTGLPIEESFKHVVLN
jgi:putative phosphoesterase